MPTSIATCSYRVQIMVLKALSSRNARTSAQAPWLHRPPAALAHSFLCTCHLAEGCMLPSSHKPVSECVSRSPCPKSCPVREGRPPPSSLGQQTPECVCCHIWCHCAAWARKEPCDRLPLTDKVALQPVTVSPWESPPSLTGRVHADLPRHLAAGGGLPPRPASATAPPPDPAAGAAHPQ